MSEARRTRADARGVRPAVVAAFADPERLATAWRELPRIVGEESAARAEVRSSTPLPASVAAVVAPGRGPGRAMLLCSILGALLGGGTALAVVLGTEAKWRLAVGGMGDIAGPPTGIVTYEGTALGLVLATVSAVLVFGGLLRKPPAAGPLDRELCAGRVLLRVDASGDRAAEIERHFRDHGAVAVATIGHAPAVAGARADGARPEPP